MDYGVIVEGTELEGSSISAMLTLDKDDFELTFHDFSPLHKLNLRAMRGRYQERRQASRLDGSGGGQPGGFTSTGVVVTQIERLDRLLDVTFSEVREVALREKAALYGRLSHLEQQGIKRIRIFAIEPLISFLL